VTEKSKQDPAPAEKGKAPAAHPEVLSKRTLDLLLNLSPDDLIRLNPDPEVIKGRARRPGGWLHAPAHFELFAATNRRLTRVAEWANLHISRVDRVQVSLIKGTKLLIIQAALTEDLTAIVVNRYAGSSSIWINLIDLLAEAGLTVQTGYRERYEVAYVPKESLVWPGLVIDLGQSKERRVESGAKKKPGQTGEAEPAAVAKEAKPSPKTESEPPAEGPAEAAEG